VLLGAFSNRSFSGGNKGSSHERGIKFDTFLAVLYNYNLRERVEAVFLSVVASKKSYPTASLQKIRSGGTREILGKKDVISTFCKEI